MKISMYVTGFFALFLFLGSFNQVNAQVLEWTNGTSSIQINFDPDTGDYYGKLADGDGTGFAARAEYQGDHTYWKWGTSYDMEVRVAGLETWLDEGKNCLIVYDGIDSGNRAAANTNGNAGNCDVADYSGYTDYLTFFYIDYDHTADEIRCVGYNSDSECNDTLKITEAGATTTEEYVLTPPILNVELLATTTCSGSSTSSVCVYEYLTSTTTDISAEALQEINKTLQMAFLFVLWVTSFLLTFFVIKWLVNTRYDHY